MCREAKKPTVDIVLSLETIGEHVAFADDMCGPGVELERQSNLERTFRRLALEAGYDLEDVSG